jgi:hypothetical protein
MSGNNGAGATGDAEFDAFASTGNVEGSFDATGGEAKADDKAEAKPAAKRGPPREAPKQETAKAPAGDEDADEGAKAMRMGEGEGDEDEDEKPKKTARDHQIERLKREKSDLNRRLRALEGGAGTAALQAQITALESTLDRRKYGNDTKTAGTAAPDPSDTEKYPLGHLDDRYIEDKLEWLAEQKATKLADSALHRQQENEQNAAIERAQGELLGKVDALAEKGSELFDDFQESVVEAGMRGDWKLTQTTFEAAHDAENGAQILYDLANDPKEAARVANLPPIKQLKYVLDKDAELGPAKAKPGPSRRPAIRRRTNREGQIRQRKLVLQPTISGISRKLGSKTQRQTARICGIGIVRSAFWGRDYPDGYCNDRTSKAGSQQLCDGASE